VNYFNKKQNNNPNSNPNNISYQLPLINNSQDLYDQQINYLNPHQIYYPYFQQYHNYNNFNQIYNNQPPFLLNDMNNLNCEYNINDYDYQDIILKNNNNHKGPINNPKQRAVSAKEKILPKINHLNNDSLEHKGNYLPEINYKDRVNYKPHTYQEYKNIEAKIVLGRLGPNIRTKEWEIKKEKVKKINEISEDIKIRNVASNNLNKLSPNEERELGFMINKQKSKKTRAESYEKTLKKKG